jgi:hypothetical protein
MYPAAALVSCPICLEDLPESEGFRCGGVNGHGRHFSCRGCMQMISQQHLWSPTRFRAHPTSIPCYAGESSDQHLGPWQCGFPWALEELRARNGLPSNADALLARARARARPFAELRAEVAAEKAAALAAAAALPLGDRVDRLVGVIAVYDVALRCPQCATQLEGNLALHVALECSECQASVCALCEQSFDAKSEGHAHFRSAHKGQAVEGTTLEQVRFLKAQCLARMAGTLRSVGDVAVQRALAAALASSEDLMRAAQLDHYLLGEVELTVEELLEAAGVAPLPAATAAATAGPPAATAAASI